MTDKRTHRGPDPRDGHLFDPSQWGTLRQAVGDLSWLLSRSYADPSSLKLVGDRYALNERQRMAVRRSSCADEARARRHAHRVEAEQLQGQPLWLDGFNVLTTIEAALGGAVVLIGRDECARDLAGVHGTYRKVEETRPAIALVGEVLERLQVGPCLWYLDSPVSNSGRLRGILGEIASARGWDWRIELATNPDPLLAASSEIIATADSAILDRCARWFNLARVVVEAAVPWARCIHLSDK